MNLFAKLRMLSALFVGAIITLFVSTYTFVFRYQHGPRWWSQLSRRWSHGLIGGIGYDVENDQIHIGEDELLIVFGNHQSTAGLSEFNFWATVVLDRTPVYLVKHDLTPVVRLPVLRIGAGIPINRDKPFEAAQAIREAIPGIIANRQALFLFCDSSRRTQKKANDARKNKKLAEVPHLEEMLEHVLPPRPAGLMQILDAIGDHPVRIIEAANGFDRRVEGTSGMLDLYGSTFHVRAIEIPRASIPDGKEARRDWLNSRYLGIARWLAQKRHRPHGSLEMTEDATKKAHVA